MVTPYVSREGKRAARQADRCAGMGGWKKRRPSCNGEDRGKARRESVRHRRGLTWRSHQTGQRCAHWQDGQDSWSQRRQRINSTTGRAGQLARRQHGCCPVCHQALDNGEEVHVHHVRPKQHSGTDDLTNFRLVHHTCHRQIHSSSAPLGVRRWLEPCTR